MRVVSSASAKLIAGRMKEEGRSDIHGLTGREFNLNPLTGQSVFVYPFPPGATAFRPDPLHRYSDVAQQLGGHANPATMEGFIRNFAMTTLEKFCQDPQGQSPHMSDRVDHANSLSQTLQDWGTASVRADVPLAPIVTPVAGIRRLATVGTAPQLSAFQQLMQGVKEQCLSQGCHRNSCEPGGLTGRSQVIAANSVTICVRTGGRAGAAGDAVDVRGGEGFRLGSW
jgi:hypothetical protein